MQLVRNDTHSSPCAGTAVPYACRIPEGVQGNVSSNYRFCNTSCWLVHAFQGLLRGVVEFSARLWCPILHRQAIRRACADRRTYSYNYVYAQLLYIKTSVHVNNAECRAHGGSSRNILLGQFSDDCMSRLHKRIKINEAQPTTTVPLQQPYSRVQNDCSGC